MKNKYCTSAVVAALLCGSSVLLLSCKSRQQRFQSRMQSMPTPAEIMAERDDDADGRLTLEEFKDGARRNPEQTFAAADANADGFLYREELDDFVDALRARAAQR